LFAERVEAEIDEALFDAPVAPDPIRVGEASNRVGEVPGRDVLFGCYQRLFGARRRLPAADSKTRARLPERRSRSAARWA